MLKDVFVNGNGGVVGAVTRLGLPVVLALGLTYFLVARVDTSQATILDRQDSILSEMRGANGKMTAFVESARRENAVRLALMLQTCLNTAKTEGQQRACLDAVQ